MTEERSEPDENSPGMQALRAYEKERQEQFAIGVDFIPLDVSDLRRAMSQLVSEDIRPDRAERRARLVSAIARGRCWLDEIVSGSVIDAEQLAKRERCTVRQVNLSLSLAFLAPPLVKAAVDGRLPRGINIERLRDPDVLWSRQFQDLGLSSN